VKTGPAALVVGGDGPLGQAVAARLAAVARVVLGTVDPARSGPALAEIERVRALYGRDETPALTVAPDVPALVRSARRLLPDGHGVVLVEPAPDLDLARVVQATAPGTVLVVVTRARIDPAPLADVLTDGRTLHIVGVEAAAPWGGRSTAAEVGAARTVRDLLVPSDSAA